MPKQKKRGLIERKTKDLKLSGLDSHFTLLLGPFLIKMSDVFLLKCIKRNRRASVRNTERH